MRVQELKETVPINDHTADLVDELRKHYSGQKSNVGTALREYRKSLGLTQEGFAIQIGVKRSAYASWEYGTSKPSIKHARQICKSLGVAIDDIAATYVSDDIRAQRKLRGLTQAAFARLVGVSDSLISCWECGYSKPTILKHRRNTVLND